MKLSFCPNCGELMTLRQDRAFCSSCGRIKDRKLMKKFIKNK